MSAAILDVLPPELRAHAAAHGVTASQLKPWASEDVSFPTVYLRTHGYGQRGDVRAFTCPLPDPENRWRHVRRGEHTDRNGAANFGADLRNERY